MLLEDIYTAALRSLPDTCIHSFMATMAVITIKMGHFVTINSVFVP